MFYGYQQNNKKMEKVTIKKEAKISLRLSL